MCVVPTQRCTPARLRGKTDAELQQYIDDYHAMAADIAADKRAITSLCETIVRLRRELDSARNHVPLLGTVFNGTVL